MNGAGSKSKAHKYGRELGEPADSYVAFCEKNKMVSIGHCLVWHNQVLRCVFRYDSGKALTRDALSDLMKDHVMSIDSTGGTTPFETAGWLASKPT
jgi:GH35 family endo-1,4-beta-xylanase